MQMPQNVEKSVDELPPVHQEQIAAEQFEHVPLPQNLEQIVEGVKVILLERFHCARASPSDPRADSGIRSSDPSETLLRADTPVPPICRRDDELAVPARDVAHAPPLKKQCTVLPAGSREP